MISVAAILWASMLVSSDGSLSQPIDHPATSRTTATGWFINPTPGNVSLLDAQGEWVLSRQGEAPISSDLPHATKKQWVLLGTANYGYGCMRMSFKHEDKRVTEIYQAQYLPLSSCRRLRSLRRIEKSLR